jgi:methylated-DNA-[protein]-cysteine S-methyltransferase
MKSKTENRRLVFETSFGVCAVLFRDNPFKIVHVLLPAEDEETLRSRVDAKDWGAPGSHPHATEMARAIADYFDGKKPKIAWPPWDWLDFENLTPLEKKVLAAAADIPRGETRSYKELAETVGKPRAYRFVGSTMAKNPFPITIPCHRVVRRDGTVGKFGGGTEMKKRMIELEAAAASPQTT